MDAPGTFATRLFHPSWLADQTDWDAIYAEYLPRVYNFLRYRVGPDEAEDLSARVFEKAWIKRHRYRNDLAGFGTWLIAISRNEAIDHLRRRRCHEPIESAAAIPSADSTPEEKVYQGRRAERLRVLLSKLGDRDRELISLKFGAGLNNREIARATGLGESNVGTLLHRTIERLRSMWEEGTQNE